MRAVGTAIVAHHSVPRRSCLGDPPGRFGGTPELPRAAATARLRRILALTITLATVWLPTAEVGTVAWWIQKAPLMAASALILAAIVCMVSGTERGALLAPRAAFNGGQVVMLSTAAGTSAAVKAWANGSVTAAAIGMVVVLIIWFGVLRPGQTTDAL